METNIATNIETSLFYSIIEFLKENGWKLAAEYDEDMFDKGIDFDLYHLGKNGETVLLVWSNWFEGEIKATAEILNEIAQHFTANFNFGEPEYLNRPDFVKEMENLVTFNK